MGERLTNTERFWLGYLYPKGSYLATDMPEMETLVEQGLASTDASGLSVLTEAGRTALREQKDASHG